MRRIWLYIKESTYDACLDALRGFVTQRRYARDHKGRRTYQDDHDAAVDLQRARRLTETGVTREEVEHASDKQDQKGGP